MGIALIEVGQVRTPVFLLTLLCFSSTFFAVQSQMGSQTGKAQNGTHEPLRVAQASRVDRAPKMDGTLDDPLWKQATPIFNFLQREPYEAAPRNEPKSASSTRNMKSISASPVLTPTPKELSPPSQASGCQPGIGRLH